MIRLPINERDDFPPTQLAPDHEAQALAAVEAHFPPVRWRETQTGIRVRAPSGLDYQGRYPAEAATEIGADDERTEFTPAELVHLFIGLWPVALVLLAAAVAVWWQR